MRQLISLGAAVNHPETDRSSPLNKVLNSYGPNCSEEAVLSMIKLLLRAGADVNAEGSYGLPPLSKAIRSFGGARQSSHRRRRLFVDVVTTLLRAGASVAEVDCDINYLDG